MDRKDTKNNFTTTPNGVVLPHLRKRALRNRQPTKRQFKFPPPKPKAEKPLPSPTTPVNGSNLSGNELPRDASINHKAITSLLSSSSGIGTGTTVDLSSILPAEISNLPPDFTSGDDNTKVCFNVSNFNPDLLAISEETECFSQSCEPNLCVLNGSRLRLRNKEGKLCVNTCENEYRRLLPAGKQNGRLCLRNDSKSRQSLEFVLWARDRRIKLEEITDLDVALHVINGVIERHKSKNKNKTIIDTFQRKMNCKFNEIISQIRVENEWTELVQSLARADAEKDRLEYELTLTNRMLEAANEYRNKRQKLNSFINNWRKCSDILVDLI